MSRTASEDLHALTTPDQFARMRRNWRFQHVGWAVIAALVAAGAAGAFGSGPLSATTRSADGVTLDFDRFVRRGTPFVVKVRMALPPGDPEARLSLPRRYFDRVRVSSVMPRPLRVVTASDATTFVFAVDHPTSSLAIAIHGEALESGRLEGAVAAGGARVPFTQFVWP